MFSPENRRREELMKLCIAEKASVAQAIGKVLGCRERGDGYVSGNGYIVSWCVGHLVELAAPEVYDERYGKWRREDLPILPEKWLYEVSLATKKQYSVLKQLMARDDVEMVVNCCDAGREGELIFRHIYEKVGCRKPIERLWISSMEDSAIREGFANLKPGVAYDALHEAAVCRERADWLVGINATRLYSVLYGKTLNIGRVMTPTLALAVERESAIASFVPETFYNVMLPVGSGTASSERMQERQDAEQIIADCSNHTAVVKSVDLKHKSDKPPALYDLTTLQREANRLHGFTAQQTLDYLQSLYEKKLCTYPRTDSRYLTSDMTETIPKLADVVRKALPYTEGISFIPDVSRVINDKKVSDHHAVIPTMSICGADINSLPKGEQAILEMVEVRLLVALSAPHEYDETTVTLDCAGHTFTAKGKTVTDAGWKGIEEAYKKSRKGQDHPDEKDNTLPQVSEGDTFDTKGMEIKEGKTTPPKHFTEDTLLNSMERAGLEDMPDDAERKGLGTPATRAAIIEKLVRTGFIERQGSKKTQFLIPTEKGKMFVSIVPEKLKSATMTAEWEQALLEIEKEHHDSGSFMDGIAAFVAELVSDHQVQDAVRQTFHADKVFGKCPVCGNDVVDRPKGYFCTNRECKFALWKENRFVESLGKKMTPQIAHSLIDRGKAFLKGCKSKKTGKKYDTTLILETDADGKPSFQLAFANGKGGNHGKS